MHFSGGINRPPYETADGYHESILAGDSHDVQRNDLPASGGGKYLPAPHYGRLHAQQLHLLQHVSGRSLPDAVNIVCFSWRCLGSRFGSIAKDQIADAFIVTFDAKP